MSETLQIEKSSAITAYENAKNSGKKLLEDLFGKKNLIKDLKDRFKTLDDVFEWHGTTAKEFYYSCSNLREHEIGNREVELIVSAFNQGETPDFSNDDQIKRYPIFEMGSPSGVGFRFDVYDFYWTYSYVGARLVYLCESDVLEYAVTTFIESYKKAYTK